MRLGAGPREYEAQVHELLENVGIDALIVCYVDRLEGDPEGVLEAVAACSAGPLKAGRGVGRALQRPAPGE